MHLNSFKKHRDLDFKNLQNSLSSEDNLWALSNSFILYFVTGNVQHIKPDRDHLRDRKPFQVFWVNDVWCHKVFNIFYSSVILAQSSLQKHSKSVWLGRHRLCTLLFRTLYRFGSWLLLNYYKTLIFFKQSNSFVIWMNVFGVLLCSKVDFLFIFSFQAEACVFCTRIDWHLMLFMITLHTFQHAFRKMHVCFCGT